MPRSESKLQNGSKKEEKKILYNRFITKFYVVYLMTLSAAQNGIE
jgi:hypothetical protein